MLRPVLLGFSDFFDEVGAVKSPAPKAAAPKPAASPPRATTGTQKNVKLRTISKAKQSAVTKHHAQTLNKAKQTLLKAARGIGKAQVALAQRPSPAAAAHATAAVRSAAAKATTAKAAAVHAQQAPSVASVKSSMAARGAAAKAILGAVAATVAAKKPVNPTVAANLSPKAKAAVAKHNTAIAASKKAAQALAQQTLKTRKSVQALAKAAVNQKKVSKKLRTKGATHVGWYGEHETWATHPTQVGRYGFFGNNRYGLYDNHLVTHPTQVGTRMQVGALVNDPIIGEELREALWDYYTHVGADPDPANPGFLTDGTPDPAFATTDTSAMPTTDTSLDTPSLISPEDAAALSESDDNPLDNVLAAQGLAPMAPDQPTESDYKAVGGILYNESKGRPNGFVASYGLLSRKTSSDAPGVAVSGSDPGVNDYGVVWGSFDQDSVPNGTPWGGRLTENQWNHLHGRFVRGGSGSFNETIPDSEAFASPNKIAPNNQAYGPLIGNPGLPDFKGMRVDAQGNMFWYPQEAPDWLTAPLKQAAALTAAKEAKAAEDEKKQFALEEEKKRRDEAAAQAASDAANALAESQSASQAKIAQQEETTKQAAEVTAQAQQETAYQQAQVEQSKAEAEQQAQAAQQLIEESKTEAAAEQQAQQLLIQRAQRQEALMVENPDIALAIMAQQAGVLGPDEGGEEEAPSDEGDEGGEEGGDEETTLTDEDAADFNDSGDFSEG